jgi:hypothetical protein
MFVFAGIPECDMACEGKNQAACVSAKQLVSGKQRPKVYGERFIWQQCMSDAATTAAALNIELVAQKIERGFCRIGEPDAHCERSISLFMPLNAMGPAAKNYPLTQGDFLEPDTVGSSLGRSPSFQRLPKNDPSRNKTRYDQKPCKQYQLPLYFYVFIGWFCVLVAIYGVCSNGRPILRWSIVALGAIGLLTDLGACAFGNPATFWKFGWLLGKEEDCEDSQISHNFNTVTQKLLTLPYYCNTLISIGRSNMANVLSIDKQIAIISALAEGSGIRQIERITGVHRLAYSAYLIGCGSGQSGNRTGVQKP